MELQSEDSGYKLVFERTDRRPITEACREMVGLIATNDRLQSGEVVYTRDDAATLELMASIAIHANTQRREPFPLSSQQLTDFTKVLAHFGTIEAAKEAIHEEIRRSGVLSNPRIEARAMLGRKVRLIAAGLKIARARLDDDAAAQANIA